MFFFSSFFSYNNNNKKFLFFLFQAPQKQNAENSKKFTRKNQTSKRNNPEIYLWQTTTSTNKTPYILLYQQKTCRCNLKTRLKTLDSPKTCKRPCLTTKTSLAPSNKSKTLTKSNELSAKSPNN